MPASPRSLVFFFFNDTATTEIYTLSLPDALPIRRCSTGRCGACMRIPAPRPLSAISPRSEEHTSELQSQSNVVCRLLLEKNKKASIFVHRASFHSLPEEIKRLAERY